MPEEVPEDGFRKGLEANRKKAALKNEQARSKGRLTPSGKRWVRKRGERFFNVPLGVLISDYDKASAPYAVRLLALIRWEAAISKRGDGWVIPRPVHMEAAGIDAFRARDAAQFLVSRGLIEIAKTSRNRRVYRLLPTAAENALTTILEERDFEVVKPETDAGDR